MQFQQGANVFTTRGQEVGPIGRVVVDPRTKAVTHIVIRKGGLFTYDRVVPIHLVAEATDDRITLDAHAGDPHSLAPFEETYVFSESPEQPVAVEVEKYIPRGTVALKQGANVVTCEGSCVGSVERVFTDADANLATHLLVTQGRPQEDRRLIPIAWVNVVSEDQVRLSVERDVFEQVGAYHR